MVYHPNVAILKDEKSIVSLGYESYCGDIKNLL